MPTSRSGFDVTRLTDERVNELASGFTPEERHVILHQGTERPFCGLLLDHKKPGTYVCRLCNLPLFGSSSKFHSGTGWPSFFQPIDPEHIREIEDVSHGMRRVEIRCARCDAHLGHVFDDGPRPTGLRYCLNSVSMEFVDEGTPITLRS
jgi:peptide-methionine (R)-S-oxide reductase